MSNLNPPDDFSFPFPPYEIQKQFMGALFNALEGKKLGIFESPTGTGKSLSLICGALTWLELHSANHKEELKTLVEENIGEIEGDDWFKATTKKIEREKERREAKVEIERIQRREKRMQSLRSRKENRKKKFIESKKSAGELFFEEKQKEKGEELVGESDLSMEESEFLLEDYRSDEERERGESEDEEREREGEEDQGCLKIFFCSRTHSQLSQFVREIQKTRFKSSTRVCSLASRQNLCVNEQVAKLPNLAMINDKCKDLQTCEKGRATKREGGSVAKRNKTSSGCPFRKQINVQHLADEVLVEVHDLEDLVNIGRKLKACPYYASRNSVKDAQLVVLPYNCLLHRSTREACNIVLKDNVVIVDEAHNLLETIGNIHSATVNYPQLCMAQCQLSEYLRRYQKRLSPKNLLYIKQLCFVLKAYVKVIGRPPPTPPSPGLNVAPSSPSLVLNVQDFLYHTLTDNLNLFKLVQYLDRSNIAHKVHGYRKLFEGELKSSQANSRSNGVASSEVSTISSFLSNMAASSKGNKNSKPRPENPPKNTTPKQGDPKNEHPPCGSPLMGVTEFLRCISCGKSDGRIVVNTMNTMNTTNTTMNTGNTANTTKNKGSIKFLLLNPASQFHDIVRECRSVIVAGGTMSPMGEFRSQLFLAAGSSPERVTEFTCNHVVPGANVLPIVLKNGPGKRLLDFTFKNRTNPDLLSELGRTLSNLCAVIPGGLVCFFPSYDYEQQVNKFFQDTGVVDRITKKKKVFREPRKSGEMERVLREFSEAAREPGGAVLFSVVGGKMSEGINFSDELGRCVLIVGLPYPNSTSPELKEKMAYLNRHYPSLEGKSAGELYYESLCFKAVNQSIGRAIRHSSDYAVILLSDHRYASLYSRESLPYWIRERVRVCEGFGEAFGAVRKFFISKKEDGS